MGWRGCKNLSFFSSDGLRGDFSRLAVPAADVVDVLGVDHLPPAAGLVLLHHRRPRLVQPGGVRGGSQFEQGRL